MTQWIALLLVAICGYLALRLRSSSLSKIPAAHWSARFSPIWILWKRYTGKELHTLVDAHQKHGSIVLVGPQDLSVSCYQDGIRRVYDSGYPKPAPFYSMFNYYRQQNAFTSLDRSEHGLRRRRTAALYSKSALMQSQHLRDITRSITYDRLLPKLNSVAQGNGRIDGLDLSYCICVDYLSSFIFGYSNGTNYLSQPKSAIDVWRFHYENLMCQESFFVQETPSLYKLLRYISIDLLPRKYTESADFLERWMSDMASKADRATDRKRSTGLPLALEDEPVVYDMAKEAVRKDSPHLSEGDQRKQVASEMFDHISAAREVLGLVLGYAFWYLAQHPDAQQRIQTELNSQGIDMRSRETVTNSSKRPRAVELDSLPYLRAVIDECLRMRPTSTPLPRITPPNRKVSVTGIDGIPPGTRINTFQWFVHRDPQKWDNAHDWNPDRWLTRGNTDNKNEREDVLWAFASGPRMCLGNNWTYYAMQHILATICSSFNFTALPREESQCWPGSPEDELPIRVCLRN